MKRIVYWGAVLIVAALVVVWGTGEVIYPSTNPPERYSGVILSTDSDQLLRRACFDCHSNETRHPWYRHVPVAGLVLANHIVEGREHLNFSQWGRMGLEDRHEAVAESIEAMREGEMPTFGYTTMHPDAKFTQADVQRLAQEAARQGIGLEGGERGEYEEDDDD